MTPQEFVTAVYNLQEGVVIDDLWPTDDKYKEVLYQANLVIDDLMKQNDWSWARELVVLGGTDPLHPGDITIPKYELPPFADRFSMDYDDCIKLHYTRGEQVVEDRFIEVPFSSHGYVPKRGFREYDAPLYAVVNGRVLTFTRRPHGRERHKAVVASVQKTMPHIHICNDKCHAKEYKDSEGNKTTEVCYKPNNYHPCDKIEKNLFPGLPDPDYMVWKTAYMTSKYSPIAGGIRAELNDSAQKLLSKMRQIDAGKTAPDIVRKSFNYKIRQVW